MTYVIAQPCVDLKDKACIEECPVDCIYEGERMLYIHPDECVDCGACEPVCPVEAIFYEDDVPEQWKDYYKANVEFFDDLGSPGGAAKLGKIDKDHPIVAALPAAGATSTDRTRSSGRLPDFPWDTARPPYAERGAGAPRRHRRPVRRHPGRPDARRRPGGAARGVRRARLPDDARHRPRCARRPRGWLDRRCGAPGSTPTTSCRRSAPRSSSRWLPTLLGLGPGDRVRRPRAGVPDVRRRGAARRAHGRGRATR